MKDSRVGWERLRLGCGEDISLDNGETSITNFPVKPEEKLKAFLKEVVGTRNYL